MDILSSAQAFVMLHGYFLIFLAMIIEGPVITTAAAFAASLGHLNIWLIFLLSLVGDLIGDAFHYVAGKMFKKKFIKYSLHLLGKKTFFHLKRQFKHRSSRTLVIVKITPPLTSAGLFLAGAFDVPFRTFITYSFLIGIPRTLFYTMLGFFFGFLAARVLGYFSLGQYWIFIFLLLAIVVYILLRLLWTRFARRFD